MAIDLEREVVAALASPEGQAAIATVLETVLDRRARQAAAPLVGMLEASKMLGVQSKTDRLAVKTMHERCRRDPALAKIKRLLGGRAVFDRAELEQYISERTKGGDRG